MNETIARLRAAAAMSTQGMDRAGASCLKPLHGFGSNPGALSAWFHVPEDMTGVPLVVVLHGCTQTAAGYDRGSGWSELSERFGFALLFPEQSRANNPNGCFNWFVPEDTRRDGGEAASIRQMVVTMIDRHPIDSGRVFITGLSAGGAMTSVMLATYPEIFAGGAIIAGLPHRAASSMPEAFDRMRGHGHVDDETAAAAIRAASHHRGAWPTVSVWHGSADRTVDAANADRIVGQWRRLQGLADRPDREEDIAGHRHTMWEDTTGKVTLEEYRIAGLGHGTPLRSDGETACGTPMPFMLDAGISSTWHIAQRWGLLTAERRTARPSPDAASATPSPATAPASVQSSIEAALRAAGLMR